MIIRNTLILKISALIIYFLALMIIIFNQTSFAKHVRHGCPPSSCGNIPEISYPFRLQTDPDKCGDQRYQLSCENNRTVLYFDSRRFYVQAIHYNNYTIHVSYPGVQKGNCSSIPESPIGRHDLISQDIYDTRIIVNSSRDWFYGTEITLAMGVMFLNCENPVVRSDLYINNTCINDTILSSNDLASSRTKRHSYVLLDNDPLLFSDFEASCHVERMALIKPWRLREDTYRNVSYMEIHNALAYGFDLSWLKLYGSNKNIYPECYTDIENKVHCDSTCRVLYGTVACGGGEKFLAIYGHYKTLILLTGSMLATRTTLGALCVVVLLIFKWRRRHLSMYDYIEDFLQSQNNFMPIRYSYSEIRNMAKGFKDKLGEGGYGSVYKGKLRSGRLVAIKMLGKSKANGQDFINEVATIGRIHHANVVQLIGFCVEGSKRALVYEFMPNGSLDKHIFSGEGISSLSCNKMYEVSLGVARAIEYLHQGCEMQILHFDIKPHNILLDENFSPKVSDFGLARLCPSNVHTISLTAARGTLGYIAPELFYKNIGGISDKADVYSFGMLLMEMASRRKNLNPVAENSSQIYFPSWVSERVLEGKEIDVGVASEEESEIVKKMMIVALWCIQLKPCDRPSMNKVVEMLEKELECLQTPPTKFSFLPRQEPPVDITSGKGSSNTRSSAQYSEDDSASLVWNTST